MTGSPRITGYGACARCSHGRDSGTVCAHHEIRARLQQATAPTAQARGGTHLCGPNAAWHDYQPAGAEAPPLIVV